MSDEQHQRYILEQLERRQLVLFIGADLPREVTGLPSRADLARELAQREGLDPSLSLAAVAQRVSRAGNRFDFTSFIRDELDTAGKSPQPFHRRIVALVQEHHIETIITTAYDDLLRRAFQDAQVGVNHVVRGSDMQFIEPKHPTLIKLYSDVGQADTLVVTDSDHSALLHDRDREAVVDEVRQALRKTVLFLGYNLADPDFRFLFDQVAESEFARTVYVVWPGLPDADVQVWRDRGVVILAADPFSILGGAPFAPQVRPEQVSPSEPPQPPAGEPPDKPSSEDLPQIITPRKIPLKAWEVMLLQHIYPGLAQVNIKKEFHGGFSGARVFLTLPITQDGRRTARKVTKIGPAAALRAEQDNYRPVERDIPLCGTQVKEYHEEGDQAALNYVFVGGGTLGQAKSLEEYYQAKFPDVEKVVETLDGLLDENLGSIWYSQHRPLNSPLAAEYGPELVEHLRLRLRPASSDALWPMEPPQPAVPGYEQIGVSDIPHRYETLQPGTLVWIEGLVVEKIKDGVAKLRDQDGIRGILVRVDLGSQGVTAQTLEPGSTVGVRGEVVHNRHDRMKAIVKAIFPELQAEVDGESIQLPCETEAHAAHLTPAYCNPLGMYADVLEGTPESRKSFVHGDLHLRNVLVDKSGRGWLIDFAEVGERHNLFDFIRLETRVRTWELSREECGFSLCDYVQFEEALSRKALGLGATPPSDPHLRFAYEVILAIRRIAQKYMGPEPDFRNEYFPALFLYCLAVTRYYPNEGGEAARLAFVTACVLGKYIGGEDASGGSAGTNTEDKPSKDGRQPRAPKRNGSADIGVSAVRREPPPAITITKEVRMRVINALVAVPAAVTFGGRTALLANLPPGVIAGLNRHGGAMVDLTNIVTQLDGLGRLASGEWPLLILIDNARAYVAGLELDQTLKEIRDTLEALYGGRSNAE